MNFDSGLLILLEPLPLQDRYGSEAGSHGAREIITMKHFIPVTVSLMSSRATIPYTHPMASLLYSPLQAN